MSLLVSLCCRMSFPNKADRENCWNRRDEYWKCLDEGKSPEECIEFRKQYEKFCPSQWVSITNNIFPHHFNKALSMYVLRV